ncbi:hypothetical protein PSEUBRA_004695 [Kalmanozyma brasiliensis GHG001]|uniref:uncharacterized protein n=1 Tax=Kalmanozyma brasiliensis (strain GHG001) TaxID=1365824 RepID=UPI00286836E9|nr:uncharacterized protein PSEUBRA_004695 [Kalmanozyma brasiliensis GHG001]KAF6767412.1 hypothetical protein PSEUBRA_004695 [Kalmanozyma brasiliensis GHG001]
MTTFTLILLLLVGCALASPLDPLPPTIPDHPLFPSSPDLQSLHALQSAYTTHMKLQLSRVARVHRTLRTFTTLQAQMRSHFAHLTTPHTLEHTLERINDLRSAGYRFGADVDPGLHVPWGTEWDYERFGPYPSTRLASARGGDAGKLERELENAWDALDRQTLMEVGRGKSGMVYTDDVGLLRSALEWQRGRLDGLREVGEESGKVRL